MPAAPSVTGNSTPSGGSVTLYASGTGTLDWYNASTGGTLINTGTSYTISNLTSNDTLYVENDVAHAVQAVGMPSSTLSPSSGGYYTSTAEQGLIFDTYQPVIINTVDVYANSTSSRTINLKNSSGAILNTLTTNITSGHQTVTLNFNVPAGTGFVLSCTANNDLWRETTDASFPYTIPALMSITGNTAADAVHYYYFYNWQVTQSPCTSPRVPVYALVTTGINEFSGINFMVYPNPATNNLTIETPSHSTIEISNIEGQLLKSLITGGTKTNIDVSALPGGVYIIEVKTEDGVGVRKFVIE